MIFASAALLVFLASSNPFDDFEARLPSARSLSGQLTTTIWTRFGSVADTTTFSFLRPNFSRVETRVNGELQKLAICDGTTQWFYDPIRKRLDHQDANQTGFLYIMPLLEPFLTSGEDAKTNAYVACDVPTRRATFHGSPAIEIDVQHRRSRVDVPGKRVQRAYLDLQSGLPVGFYFWTPDRQGDMVYDRLRIDQEIDPSIFKWVPGAFPVGEGDVADSLLPVGSLAPSFTGKRLDGKPFDLAATLNGAKLLILDIWGYGCRSCMDAVVELETLARAKYGKGLRFVNVCYGSPKQLSEFAERRGVLSPIVPAESCSVEIESVYRATSASTIYIIDRSGKIVAHYADSNVDRVRADVAAAGL